MEKSRWYKIKPFLSYLILLFVQFLSDMVLFAFSRTWWFMAKTYQELNAFNLVSFFRSIRLIYFWKVDNYLHVGPTTFGIIFFFVLAFIIVSLLIYLLIKLIKLIRSRDLHIIPKIIFSFLFLLLIYLEVPYSKFLIERAFR